MAVLIGSRRSLRSFGRQLQNASTGKRRSSFAFSGWCNGSAYFRAISDQTDVGISDALHSGIGFFGHPNAAAPDPPCGEVCSARTGRAHSVSMFHNNYHKDDLGPLSTPAMRHSRRVIQQNPNLTAYLLVQALNSLLWLVTHHDAWER